MAKTTKDNPFAPGFGKVPPLLAGREEEIKLFECLLAGTQSPRMKCGRLQSAPQDPIVLAAPRGAGRRALLAWLEREARGRGIRVARCSRPGPKGAGGGLYEDLLAAMADEKNGWMGEAARAALRAGLGTADVARIQAAKAEGAAVRYLIEELPKKERLLLIVDDFERYSQSSLDAMLIARQRAIRQGHAFALVLAGKTLVDNRLFLKSEVGDVCYSKFIHIGALSDEAAREALRAPFARAGVEVAPRALKMLAAQAGNYPYFIQLAGAEAWGAMTAAGRSDVDVELVRRSAARARQGREAFHRFCYDQVKAKGLLPYAFQAVEWMERAGGEINLAVFGDLMKKHNHEVDHRRSLEISEGLLAAGFIQMEDVWLKQAHPFLFSHFKSKEHRRKPPEDDGFRLHDWLANFLPGFAFWKTGG